MYYKSMLKNLSQNLRREMTKEECHLWYDYLKHCGVTFYRQKPIRGYIVDFYCASKKLVIELDGGQHYEDDARQYDVERSNILKEEGIRVIRFTNRQIHENFRDVCEYIDKLIKS